MKVLNWICFIIVFSDTLGYIVDKSQDKIKNFACLLGFLSGIAARVYVLYNTVTYWLLV